MMQGYLDPGVSRSNPRGRFLSRQDSRNLRSSASPPPSRSSRHASSWFGHRRTSLSPPRSRLYAYQSDYADYRNSKYGRSSKRSSWFGRRRRDSLSPPRSSYLRSQSNTKYKEDYTGYPQGYTIEGGYAPGYLNPPAYGYEPGYAGRAYATGSGYPSAVVYGEHSPSVARTYQSSYYAPNALQEAYAEVVKLRVPLCCEDCEDRISNYMLAMEGVQTVTVDTVKQKVTVRGTASPAEVLRQARECFRSATFW